MVPIPPIVNATTAASDPRIASACAAVPRAAPGCTDAGAVPPPPDLVYYQVRAACADGAEGDAMLREFRKTFLAQLGGPGAQGPR